MNQVWISAAGLCGSTVIGSLLGYLIKELPHKWNDTILGYCAGIMLAAATLGLIVPAFEMSNQWWLVAAGVMSGALFLNVLDLVTPHLHHITGLDEAEHHHNTSLNHVMLFVMAIALHKLPEGMAAGVSMSDTTGGENWTVSLGIALQNVPEGMVIIAPPVVGRSQATAHFFHILSHRFARNHRRMDWLRHGQYFRLPASHDVRFCRWRHALCHERRNDTRNARPRLSEASHLRPIAGLHDAADD